VPNKRKRIWIIALALLAFAALLLGLTGAALRKQPPAQVIAHRGANAYAPENTLPTFEKAIELGAHGVECDVYVTADGYVVLSHDGSVNRCSDGEGKISEMTLEELKGCDFGYSEKFGDAFAGTKIPTLEEFLNCVKDVAVILIELKNNEGGIAAKTVQAVKEFDLMGKVIFQSFDMEAILACKEADGNAYIALLYNPGGEFDKVVRKDPVGFCVEYGLDALHPQFAAMSSGIARKCAAIGVELRTWTANDILFLIGGSGQGAVGLITDQPELAQKLVRLPGFVRGFFALLCDAAFLLSPLFG